MRQPAEGTPRLLATFLYSRANARRALARFALESRAFQGQINRLRLRDCDPADLWNIDAAIFKFDSLRNSE